MVKDFISLLTAHHNNPDKGHNIPVYCSGNWKLELLMLFLQVNYQQTDLV